MNVTPDGYALMTHMLKNLADEICQGRIVFVMEGGYSAEGIRGCGRRVFQELAGLPTLACDTIRQAVLGKPESLPELRKAMEVHRKYWPPRG
jgi:acetoin utilization deacetylase AcuC-like enzyme